MLTAGEILGRKLTFTTFIPHGQGLRYDKQNKPLWKVAGKGFTWAEKLKRSITITITYTPQRLDL